MHSFVDLSSAGTAGLAGFHPAGARLRGGRPISFYKEMGERKLGNDGGKGGLYI